MFAKGDPIPNAPESIRLFALCDAMKWSVLPVAGGLYDQHPRLLEEFAVIFEERERYREKERREQERKQKAAGASKGGRR